MNSNLASKFPSLAVSSHSLANSSYHHSHSNFAFSVKFTERSRSALTALLILIIENFHLNCVLNNKNEIKNNIKLNNMNINQDLIAYLLSILENLPNFKWTDDLICDSSTNGHTISYKTSKNVYLIQNRETQSKFYNNK
jgi:hypothetical protein